MIDAQALVARPGAGLVVPEGPAFFAGVQGTERVGEAKPHQAAVARAGFRADQGVTGGQRAGGEISVGRADVVVAEDGELGIGGEEFGLLLCRSSAAEVGQLLEQLQTAAAEARPGGVGFSFSAGVAAFSTGMKTNEVLRAADQAMYAAKRLGKRQVVFAGDPAETALTV